MAQAPDEEVDRLYGLALEEFIPARDALAKELRDTGRRAEATAVKAIETVDGCLGEIVRAVQGSGGVCVVTADHGNADNMLEPGGSPNTAHSLNQVPVIVTVDGVTLSHGGMLADVAPTVLALLGAEQPPQMTGRSLLER